MAAAPHATEDRIVTDEQFVLCPPIDLTGQHALILDDTWTTGSRAQSAALTLRRAGRRTDQRPGHRTLGRPGLRR
ncbi:putative amidophosphoribosyltransferase [Mycolicibacterium sp. BK556]|uniref:phosphoribosyltransferase n=1 Tax=unclassified Mycolicibacterium TaxID=2636767 RepID=UPI00161DDD6D|nr:MULTISPECIES: phosphoribosyltransferase [unclassified Mycolicibacterium]MBB3606353.1 putative amidophosphoribosyltransferase [Mycolicibacterium sp. BK556]MBB3636401.1 putative amidophosphoribosyltransferase [Mycolicibacterium sp. BK607]